MAHTAFTVWSSEVTVSRQAFCYTETHRKTNVKKYALVAWLIALLFIMAQLALAFIRPAYSSPLPTASPLETALPSGGPSSPSISPIPVKVNRPTETVDTTSPRLRSLLDEWMRSHAQRQWAVSIEALESAKFSASINADTNFRSASIYKLFLTYSLFKKETPQSLQTKPDLAKCVDLMLRVSDNPCAETVANFVGWSATDQLLSAAGINNTHLNRSEGPVSTAADTATLLKGLYNGSLYDSASRSYIMDILKKQTRREGIPVGCSGCAVYNKTGDLGFVRHDAAIIETPKLKYILVIFTDGASYSEIAQLTKQINDLLNNF